MARHQEDHVIGHQPQYRVRVPRLRCTEPVCDQLADGLLIGLHICLTCLLSTMMRTLDIGSSMLERWHLNGVKVGHFLPIGNLMPSPEKDLRTIPAHQVRTTPAGPGFVRAKPLDASLRNPALTIRAYRKHPRVQIRPLASCDAVRICAKPLGVTALSTDQGSGARRMA